jgi:hypothetical protein
LACKLNEEQESSKMLPLNIVASSLLLLPASYVLESPMSDPGAVRPALAVADTNFSIQVPVPGLDDPFFKTPYIDKDEWRETPIRHRYVHGGYNGTQLRFSFYFPPKDVYKGRFFQALPAVSGREDVVFQPVTLGAVIADIAPFAFETGGYVVESNQGSLDMYPGVDQTVVGYRASAAAAQFSRALAVQMYGGGRPYGYVFGGSGGGYKTLACIESTTVWDGAAPFIIGSPVSIPNVFTVQAHAMRILSSKFPQIVDALEPGGSGDMYAGLNQEQREALVEVTKFGFAPPAWFRYDKIAAGYTGVFSSLLDIIIMMDPGYFTDFWTKPGYLGAAAPESLMKARIQRNTTIKRIILTKEAIDMGLPVSLSGRFAGGLNEVPAALELGDLPDGSLMGTQIQFTSGSAKGLVVSISAMKKNIAVIGFGGTNFGRVQNMKTGDEVKLDNSVYLASQTYHRHQDPGPEYPVWDQFRKNGKPIYPQRQVQLHKLNLSGVGVRQSGNFKGKVIVIEAMYDEAAYPWQADWYRKQVSKNFGDGENDRFRLWMVDKCMHTSPQQPSSQEPLPVEATRIVSYTPVIQQALRDLTQWVEKGIAPPSSTNYTVSDGQIITPPSAAERKGIQPVVELFVNGKARADVKVGDSVQFTGTIQIPPGRGKIVATDFDFEGTGVFASKGQVTQTGDYTATISARHSFNKPGTYFPALRGAGQANENMVSPFGRVTDLGRVRVVVS